MYGVTKSFHFCAAHRLHNYVGKCANIHGHNYRVDVTMESMELKDGMVLDFGEISKIIGKWIDDRMDHTLLVCNSDELLIPLVEDMSSYFKFFFMTEKTTAENIARLLFQECQQMCTRDGMVVREVKVWETESCFAVFS
jgi:6-pyruvoyltetrahydropterin/6-carboxytetrahydropterin synthase